jgi:glycosyltransferase involved in cell wall biosynthesis/peptidoglycan/xylan/chitin deacetylase (PgdA/CDA1 family)
MKFCSGRFIESGSLPTVLSLAMTISPELSVVMATFNRRRILPRALASIFAQELPTREYEVIVVVDGSTDGTLEYLRNLRPACALRIIEQSNRGLAVALNQGLEAARGRVILFTDDDIVLHPSNFRAHLDAHAAEDSLVVHGPVFVSDESADTLATEWIRNDVAKEIKRWEVGWTWPDDANVDPNYSISRAALLACGGFDEEFTWRQNVELGLRLAKMGLTFRYEPKAVGHHVYMKPADQVVRVQARWWGRKEISLLRKHPDLRPHSALAGFAEAAAWKRLAIQAVAKLPVSPDVLIRPVFVLADKFHSWSTMRRLGLRLLWKRVAISFLRGAVETVGWRNLQGEFGKRLPVLMYHHVGPPEPNSDPDLTVSTERFEAQVRFLARRGYVGIRASDWLSWIQHGKPLPKKPMLLTFDDAFEDLGRHALPVLERYGFGAVVFVVTNCVGKANIWDQQRGYALRPCLTADQIQYWSTKGIEFGAHSRNHPDLTTLEEPELRDEVAGSRFDLERIAGFPINSFAYPYGPYNVAVANCVAEHFDLAFTTDDGLNTLRTNRSLLHRNMVFGWDTPLDLEFLVRLGWNPIRRLRSHLRIRSRFLQVLRHVMPHRH